MLTHSGRQFGGEPINSVKHEQEGEPFIFLHCEFGPQGVGIQASVWIGSSIAKIDLNRFWSYFFSGLLTYCGAFSKWITCVLNWAYANRIVIYYTTFSIQTTYPTAGIYTFLINTCLTEWTLCTCYTFRSTSRWAANKTWYTWANCLTINFSALTVSPTRWWGTRIFRNVNYKIIFITKLLI